MLIQQETQGVYSVEVHYYPKSVHYDEHYDVHCHRRRPLAQIGETLNTQIHGHVFEDREAAFDKYEDHKEYYGKPNEPWLLMVKHEPPKLWWKSLWRKLCRK